MMDDPRVSATEIHWALEPEPLRAGATAIEPFRTATDLVIADLAREVASLREDIQGYRAVTREALEALGRLTVKLDRYRETMRARLDLADDDGA